MALIKCSECGQEISDTATACPKCGAPVRKTPAVGDKTQPGYDKQIYTAAILSIVQAGLIILAVTISIISGVTELLANGLEGIIKSGGYDATPHQLTTLIIIGVIINISSYVIGILIFVFGWLKIGRLTKLKFLTIISYIGIVVWLLGIPVELLALLANPSVEMIRTLALLEIVGILLLLFGISVLPLKKWFGGLATTIAIVNIVTGACAIVVICAPIALIGVAVMVILEIILLFKAAKFWGTPSRVG